MPRLRPQQQYQQQQQHHPENCECCLNTLPAGAAQTLEELDFTRSAASAAASGDLERLRRLIGRDAAAAVAVPRGSTDGFAPLHFAVRAAGNDGDAAERAVSMLLLAGADPNAETSAGKATPLHRSAFAGNLKVTEMLLAAGADASKVDADGESPAHKAAAQVSFFLFCL